ncbi:unnamed protein product [Acanthoscelides obtectus]|uniref:Uncharacterized protein n=1 Tax=Acanthoscelides obtectus TaxID=200917 RepID=A0A9P0VU97_ACAOB|nr:unnamed protein product [Acanthoscelides obtectus]CAK1682725.1 hypothetical protein AOBTE_LOCUS33829 [Acanthoscelides obtectus]
MAGTGVPPIKHRGQRSADWSSKQDDEQQGDSILQSEDGGGTSVKVFTNTPADYRQLVACWSPSSGPSSPIN